MDAHTMGRHVEDMIAWIELRHVLGVVIVGGMRTASMMMNGDGEWTLGHPKVSVSSLPFLELFAPSSFGSPHHTGRDLATDAELSSPPRNHCSEICSVGAVALASRLQCAAGHRGDKVHGWDLSRVRIKA